MTGSKSIETYLKISQKANSFLDVFQSNESQLSGIKNESGGLVLNGVILTQIHKIEEVLEIQLNKAQLRLIVNNIVTDFWHFKLADFNLIIKRLSYVKQFGKPQIGDIMSEIEQYNIERSDVAETISDIKLKKDDQDREKLNNNIKKTYEILKAKGKEPVISQKQKDREAFRVNAEKIEEMKLQGLLK